MIVMLIGGLWHGAGWTFVIWGALHGFYIFLNHAWRAFTERMGRDLNKKTWIGTSFSGMITFFAVVFAWVFFRAESYDAAINILRGMLGLNGFWITPNLFAILNKFGGLGTYFSENGWIIAPYREVTIGPYLFLGSYHFFSLLSVFIVVLFLPNTQQIMRDFEPALGFENSYSYQENSRFVWKPTYWNAALYSFIFFYLLLELEQLSEFLYFQF